MAAQAPRIVEPTPPVERAAWTRGTPKAATKPTTEKAAKTRGAIQTCSSAVCKRKPPAAVPARMAAKVQTSNRPLPEARRSCGINSGRMPYFDGPKSALCAPIPHKTINGGVPQAEVSQRAKVPALACRHTTSVEQVHAG